MQRRMMASAVIGTVLAMALAGCGGGGQGGGGDDRLNIAVVPKGTTHIYWKSIQAGANKAGEELGVDITWQGPEREDARKQQIDLVNNLVTRRVDGIVLAPLDSAALVDPVKSATGAGIPVVIIDSGLEAEAGKDYVSFVATNNRAGGRKAGRFMSELLGGEGSVIMLRYQENSESTEQREAGFLEAVREAGIEVRSSNQYAGATTNQAINRARSLLLKYTEDGELTVDGIFCSNEPTTFGMLRAMKRAGVAGGAKLVGFDVSDKLIQGMNEGHIEGLVVQDPFNMGYTGVKTIVRHIRGKEVDKTIDTGSKLVTPENMDQPKVRDLLNPPIDKWVQ